MKKANCLCGAISMEVQDIHSEVGACHCSMCRRWGAGPLLTVEAGTGATISIQPENLVTRYQSRGFLQYPNRFICRSGRSNIDSRSLLRSETFLLQFCK